MTAEPTPDDRPKRKQMNVRLPQDLIDQIDERRSHRSLSRDQIVERMLRFALTHNPPPRTPTRATLHRS